MAPHELWGLRPLALRMPPRRHSGRPGCQGTIGRAHFGVGEHCGEDTKVNQQVSKSTCSIAAARSRGDLALEASEQGRGGTLAFLRQALATSMLCQLGHPERSCEGCHTSPLAAERVRPCCRRHCGRCRQTSCPAAAEAEAAAFSGRRAGTARGPAAEAVGTAARGCADDVGAPRRRACAPVPRRTQSSPAAAWSRKGQTRRAAVHHQLMELSRAGSNSRARSWPAPRRRHWQQVRRRRHRPRDCVSRA